MTKQNKLQNSTHVKRAITGRLELENKISPDQVYQRIQSLIQYFRTNLDHLVTEGQGNQQGTQCTCYCKSHQTETYSGVPLFVNSDTQKTGVLTQLRISPHCRALQVLIIGLQTKMSTLVELEIIDSIHVPQRIYTSLKCI